MTLAAAAGMAALCVGYARGELIDDAYISIRYAENWVAGHGLVFNPGERVEGFTNFLWVVLLAGGAILGVDPEWTTRLLGAVCVVLAVLVLDGFAPRHGERPAWAAGLAPLLFTASLAPAMWAVHGLETPLFTLLLCLGFRTDLQAIDAGRASPAAAVWFALASLARPEGIPVFAARMAAGIVLEGPAYRRRGLWRQLAVYGAIVLPFLIARLAYYGDPLPNTFYAKASPEPTLWIRGLLYLSQFFASWGSLVFLPLLPALGAAFRQRRLAYAWLMLLAGLATVALEGGDAFPGFRFVVPWLPLLYFLVQEGALAAARRLARGPAVALGAALAAAALHVAHVGHSVGIEVRGADNFTRKMKLVGRALREAVPPGSWIALNPAGALPYVSGLPAIDMLGLTDAHIARRRLPLGTGVAGHEKGDGGYVLERRPALILLGNVTVVDDPVEDLYDFRWDLYGRSELELARLPALRGHYLPDAVPLTDGRFAILLRRRDVRLRER